MNRRTRIKICGITELDDALHAVRAGVDALGFIFAEESQRRIEPERAREIIAEIPPFVDCVGVFVDEEADLVRDIARFCSLTILQLHGRESVDYCRSFSRRIVKVFQVGSGRPAPDCSAYNEVASAFLLDTYHREMSGGVGESFDWGLVKDLALARPMILAGGLNADNISQAIRELLPHAVDLNSGVELEPGRKDRAGITRIVEIIRQTDLSLAEA